MTTTEIGRQRLAQQRLAHNQFQTPEEVVAWLGAVQAQDYPGTLWSLGLRLQPTTERVIEQAFDEGRILRTHVMRPTWHFVTPADIRWLLALTAPRVNAVNGYRVRQLELDDDQFSRSQAVIVKTLQGGRTRTRAELGAVLTEAGIGVQGQRLAYIMMRAELDAVVCSGPRRNKQFTYALLDERAPQSRSLPRDEALAELTRRYFTGHGPAAVSDFVWWSGLTTADARAGLSAVAADLVHMVVGGETYYFSPTMPPAFPSETAFLLPMFDEFWLGYTSADRTRRGGPEKVQNAMTRPSVVINGQNAGSWQRTFKQKTAVIEFTASIPLTPAQETAVAAAAQRYGAFVGLPVMLINM
ncbi:MAG: AlkZ family DNA glycosylase [Chloroflexi bacterium]|nr:AlkZ family DNA glycosylase [Chloroflexota bacterium]